MTDETPRSSRQKWYWIGGTILALLLIILCVWIYLPETACHFVQYDWSHEYAVDVLEWLGPKAAGAIFEYHQNFEFPVWKQLVETLFENANNARDAELFVQSFRDVNTKGYEATCGWSFATGEGHASPLHWAVEQDNLIIVKLLLENGADVNSRDYLGNTPLHVAAQGDVEIGRVLLDAGAEVNAKNTKGRTPFDLTQMRLGCTNIKMFRLLHSKGGKNSWGDIVPPEPKPNPEDKYGPWIKEIPLDPNTPASQPTKRSP